MIKIKFKKKLSEGLLRFSEDAQQKIAPMVKDAVSKKQEVRHVFEIPLKDVIYKSKSVMSGLPFLYHLNLNGELLSPEEALDGTLELIVRTYNKADGGNLAGYGASTKNGKSRIVIAFYNPNIKRVESIPNLVRHEMQHMTQNLNDVCIAYAEQLKRVGKPENVTLIPLNKKITKFGLGKQKAGNRQQSIKADHEYETYLSDTVHAFYKRLVTNHKLSLERDLSSIGEHATAVKYLDLLLKDWRSRDEYHGINQILNNLLAVRPKETPKDMLKSLEDLLKKH